MVHEVLNNFEISIQILIRVAAVEATNSEECVYELLYTNLSQTGNRGDLNSYSAGSWPLWNILLRGARSSFGST